jgi:hypothetical protein
MVDSVTALRRLDIFTDLRRRPAKRRRLMTDEEASTWANSEESHGWMVRTFGFEWSFPSAFAYTCGMKSYERARINADLSGVDESTIQGFEVEK